MSGTAQGRFSGDAEDIEPLSLVRSEDQTSPEDREAKRKADEMIAEATEAARRARAAQSEAEDELDTIPDFLPDDVKKRIEEEYAKKKQGPLAPIA